MNWSNLQKKLTDKLFSPERKHDWLLIIIIGCLALFGVAFLASASSIISTDRFNSEAYLLIRQASFGLWLGFVAAFILSQIDYHHLFKVRHLLLWTSFFFLTWVALAEFLFRFGVISNPELLNLGPFGPQQANKATRWFSTGIGINFQPVEITKLALLIYFSSFFFERKTSDTENPITFLALKGHLYALLASMILVIIQPDLGSAMLLFAVAFGCLFINGAPRKILVTIVVSMVMFASLSLLPTYDDQGVNTNYRYTRLMAFFNVWDRNKSDFKPAGNAAEHSIVVEKAIQNGGIWGEGYGNSFHKKTKQIPEVHTDSIIGVIGEEMGFVKTVLFIALYLALAIRGLQVAERAPDLFGRGLAAGIVFWISGQALLNLMSFLQITPSSGVPLPFVSYGSTSLLINLAIMGILINISSQQQESQVESNHNQNSVYQKYSRAGSRKLKKA